MTQAKTPFREGTRGDLHEGLADLDAPITAATRHVEAAARLNGWDLNHLRWHIPPARDVVCIRYTNHRNGKNVMWITKISIELVKNAQHAPPGFEPFGTGQREGMHKLYF